MADQVVTALPPLQEPAKDGAPLRRPMNAFLIFCKKHRALVREKNSHLDNRSVTRILGELWATLPAAEKDSYLSLAKQYRDAFLKANPGFHWHSNKRENQAAFKPVQRNTAVALTSGSGANSKVIEAGKLADPSKMGGLGLLLMAGSGVQANTTESQANGPQGKRTHTAMRSSVHQPSKVPARPVVPSTATRAAALTDGQDNVALLQLAEMCSSRLEASDKRPADRPSLTGPAVPGRGAMDTAPQPVNQQWLPGSYAMTPPWTPKYEGQVSPTHDTSLSSKTVIKDFPLDLSKPSAGHGKKFTNYAEPSSVDPNGTCSDPSEQTNQNAQQMRKPSLGRMENRKPYQPEQMKWDPYNRPASYPQKVANNSLTAATRLKSAEMNGLSYTVAQGGLRNPESNLNVEVLKSEPSVVKGKDAGQRSDIVGQDFSRSMDNTNPHQVGDRNCMKSSEKSGMEIPSGRMLVNQMIETVFHSDMLSEPTAKSTEIGSPQRLRKRSLSLSENSAGKFTVSSSNESQNKTAPAMTFGEIQEKLIRRAMEDSSTFPNGSSNRESDAKPMNLSHVGMDLAVRHLKSTMKFTPALSSTVTPTSDRMYNSEMEPLHSVPSKQYEGTNVGLMRDMLLDRYKKTADESRNMSSESLDLTCSENLEGYDSEDNRGKAVSGAKKAHPMGGIIGDKLRDHIETQLTSHLMANAGVLPPGFGIGNHEKFGALGLKENSGVNHAEFGTDAGAGLKVAQVNSTVPRTGDNSREDLSSSSMNSESTKSMHKGDTDHNSHRRSITVEGNLQIVEDKPKRRGKVSKKEASSPSGGLAGSDNPTTNPESPRAAVDKKVRRRRRNVFEMTVDPYGENRGQLASNGSDSAEEKSPHETDLLENLEEDESGVRKSKRRNRGQKYQELLSQGLLQVGRQRRSDSISESTEVGQAELQQIKKPRKSQASDTSPNASKDDVFLNNTGFDLDAEIASLPPLVLDGPPVIAKQRLSGPGVRAAGTRRGRHKNDHHGDGVKAAAAASKGQPLVDKDVNATKKQNQVKELSIAELGRLTKRCGSTAAAATGELKSGSQKRKARKCAITHLVQVKQAQAGETTNTQNLENMPNAPRAAALCLTTAGESAEAPSNQFNLNFATLVDVAVAENEKLRNLKEITVSCA